MNGKVLISILEQKQTPHNVQNSHPLHENVGVAAIHTSVSCLVV